MRALVGIQAQDRRAALLAIRARATTASVEAVEHALSGDRTVVRTWAMRGTLHLVAAGDLPLVLSVYGALNIARDQRRLTQVGLPPEMAERSTAQAAAILAEDGPLTRHELAARLRERGIPVGGGQAPVHVVHRGAMAGVLCERGVRGLEPLYEALDRGPLPDRETALHELARRYAEAHAPATQEDFAIWSGLPAADVRAAWQAVPPRDDQTAPPGSVRLLPAFDEWMLGWASRDLILPPRHARRAVPGGGIIRPVTVSDGRVFATWRLDRRRRTVEVEPFARLTRAQRAGLDDEIAAVLGFS